MPLLKTVSIDSCGASLSADDENGEQYLSLLREGMAGVVDDQGTAARFFKKWKYTATEVMCGKTGTSQVTIGGIKLDLENNGWFVAMTPKEDPEIAVVSFIPNGFSGAYTVSAARDFIEFYLDEKAKKSEDIDLPGGNTLAP